MNDTREMFSVPPEWTKERILEEADKTIHWAMTSGPYAPPEIWFNELPALVALLKATTEMAKEV